MDKVLSTRLDEKVIAELEWAVKKLGISKKQFLEQAITEKVEQDRHAAEQNREAFETALAETFGLWSDRPGTTEDLIANLRQDLHSRLGTKYETITNQSASDA